jgi:hypothetical protein
MPQLRFFYAAESRGDNSQRVTRFASLRARDAYVEAHCSSAVRITSAEAATLLKQRAATPLVRR